MPAVIIARLSVGQFLFGHGRSTVVLLVGGVEYSSVFRTFVEKVGY